MRRNFKNSLVDVKALAIVLRTIAIAVGSDHFPFCEQWLYHGKKNISISIIAHCGI